MVIVRFLFSFISLIIVAASCVAGASEIGAKTEEPTSKINDPIQENFGARLTPYLGFLELPPEAIPSGFKEVGHHYTKREYTVDFTKVADGKKFELNITEGDFINFVTSDAEFYESFVYNGIAGAVYIHRNSELNKTTLNLVWLNPPKQRISINLTQGDVNTYTSHDLIEILKKLRTIK